MNTKKRIFSDALANILLQVSIIGSGLILPHFIINAYGSSINGMVASINQFLSYITLLESGIGGVIKAQLYKPLLEKNNDEISGIVKSSNNFFKKIGLVFIVYLLVIASTFKFISHTDFDWPFVFTLVLILGASTLIQYFIGLTYQTLIQASQHYTFTSIVQIVTLWLNVGLAIVCIKLGGSIHVVKIITALLFAARPVCYLIYSKRKFKLNKNIQPNNKALSQRWDGFGHHIAYFIHSNTDIVLLTIFMTLPDVSVYSVYLMVVTGIRSFVSAMSSAFEPYFGRLIASNDEEGLSNKFGLYKTFHFIVTTILFGATLVLIVPFVRLYTSGVNDADYIQPIFAIVLVCAELFYCFRTPFSMVIFAAGHFKQTKIGAFVEAGINIVVSLALIVPFGLIGVAIGTLAAMLYRTLEYVLYLKKNILKLSFTDFLRKLLCSALALVSTYVLFYFFGINPSNYLQWAVEAFIAVGLLILITFACYILFDFNNTKKGIVFVRYLFKKH